MSSAVALVVGTLAGWAAGGRLRNLARQRLRWWPLLVAGLALSALSGPLGGGAGASTAWAGDLSQAGGYACLVVAAWANR
ncbi:MAG: hypothetical protein ACRDY0_13510, partial [Acidimicrobiales bacterium]